MGELTGLSTLWQIAFRVQSEAVAKMALNTLVSLPQSIPISKKKHRTKGRELFVLTCLKNIKSSSEDTENAPPEKDNYRIIER